MTKIEKIKGWIKNKAGVSPIIAIILMVAITVVLAATIYVWVSGMGTHSKNPTNAAVSVKGDNQLIRVTLVQGGKDMPSGGYTNYKIYVDGKEVKGTLPSAWDVGQSIIIRGFDASSNPTTNSSVSTQFTVGNEYPVTVEIEGTAVFDASVLVTG